MRWKEWAVITQWSSDSDLRATSVFVKSVKVINTMLFALVAILSIGKSVMIIHLKDITRSSMIFISVRLFQMKLDMLWTFASTRVSNVFQNVLENILELSVLKSNFRTRTSKIDYHTSKYRKSYTEIEVCNFPSLICTKVAKNVLKFDLYWGSGLFLALKLVRIRQKCKKNL